MSDPAAQQPPAISSCMEERVGDTLAAVSTLASPVVRTCHVGNNTSNVWGWLALAGNAYAGQYDHTLYGVDENCIPWVRLGDGGLVEACFDHAGRPRPEEIGKHVNEHLAGAQRKYFAHLNFGIFGDLPDEAEMGVEGERDLFTSHHLLARRLGEQMNGREVRCRSREIHAEADLYAALVEDFFRHRMLDRMFNRWVRTTGKKGYAVVKKIRGIEYAGDRARITAASSGTVFDGTASELTAAFLDGMEKVAHRTATAAPLGELSYPWIENDFNFLGYAVREHRLDPGQEVFWHAGGSSSSFYVNQEEVRRNLRERTDLLVAWGHLPRGARVRVIPTFCCQLFATRNESLPELVALLDAWRSWLGRNPDTADDLAEALGSTTEPFAVGAAVAAELDAVHSAELRRRLDAFNALDPNRLPVAHVSGLDHPHYKSTYNKFGLAQHHLLGVRPRYPEAFRELRWGEAELLVKALAHLVLDRQG